jgi:hypothetical protein
MSLSVVLVMEATSSPLVPQVTPAWLARCAVACSTQLIRDVSPVYGGGPYAVRVALDAKDTRTGEVVFAIVDALPQSPGAIAYHDVAGNALPVAFLALSTCSSLDDVSTAASHELCETAGDPDCNTWNDDGAGHEFCRELCDAVESVSYPVDIGDGGPPVLVSDWLLPAFFAASAPGPYSFRGTAQGPFLTAPGGYQIQRTSGGGETQVTGMIRASKIPRAKHWSSRTYRRGLRLP